MSEENPASKKEAHKPGQDRKAAREFSRSGKDEAYEVLANLEDYRYRSRYPDWAELDRLYEQGIRYHRKGSLVSAPKKPFPWWGPFDATDAVGRTVLLMGLVSLASFFVLAVMFIRQVSSSGGFYPAEFFVGMGFSTVMPLAVTTVLITTGVGILFRREWSITLFKVLLALACVPLFFGVAGFLVAGFGFLMYSLRSALLCFAGVFLLVVYFLGIVLPLWRFWRERGCRYNFVFVPVRSLRAGMFENTQRFAAMFILSGVVLLIAGAIMDFGLWGSLVSAGFYQDSTGLLRHVVLLCCIVFLPLFISFAGYRTILLILGLAAPAVVYPVSAAFITQGTRGGIPSGPMIAIPVFAFLSWIMGFWLLAAGLGFRQKNNSARLALIGAAIAGLAVVVIAVITGIVFSLRGFDIAEIEFLDISQITSGIFPLFQAMVPLYVVFEVFRYLGTDKAKAFCGAGNYTPPWQWQAERVKELEKEDDADYQRMMKEREKKKTLEKAGSEREETPEEKPKKEPDSW